MRLPSTTERHFLICPACGSRGVCDSTACHEAGGSCYAGLPDEAAEAHGQKSFIEGYAVKSCPFEEGHTRRLAWLRGYNEEARRCRSR